MDDSATMSEATGATPQEVTAAGRGALAASGRGPQAGEPGMSCERWNRRKHEKDALLGKEERREILLGILGA